MSLRLSESSLSSSPPARNVRRGIVFRGAVYGGSGYADGNLNVLSSLVAAQLPVQVLPLGPQNDSAHILSAAQRQMLEGLQQSQVDLAQGVFYQCCPAGDFETRLRAVVRVGRTAYETDSIPRGWREKCQAMDQVWVPSSFNLQTFAEAGVSMEKLRAMPEGLHTDVYRPGLEPLPIPERRGFNFLSVFDWIDRKGPDVLLRAYLDEFRAQEDVALILKVHKFDDPDLDLEAKLLFFIERVLRRRLQDAPPIIVLSGLLPIQQMPRLYASADAFVLPSRGEGWGRPYMEAAACGTPVLATRWSGHLDFLHDGNSYLIDVEGVVPVPVDSDRDIYIGDRWAEPSVEHLRQLMRRVFEKRREASSKAEQARREMVERWDWRVLGPRWAEAMQALLA